MLYKNLNFLLSVFCLIFVFSQDAYSQTTDFSPKKITAGNGSILTITGSGFGSIKDAEAYVEFPRELGFDKTNVRVQESDIVLWSDTKIQVRVPARATTGGPIVRLSRNIFLYLGTLTIENTVIITSFNPTSIAAGTRSLLTINGQNFGSTPGQVWATMSGGYIGNVASVISWSDTQIVAEIHESAGSGQIGLLINGNLIYSAGSLYVKYAVFGSPTADPIILTNNNGSGGYTFRMETSFANNIGASSIFNKVFNTWKNATGVNWDMGPITTVNKELNDNINVIKFGGTEEIIVGTLAYTAMHYRGCTSGEVELVDIDMIFNRDYNWNFTSNTPTPTQYDFETVALHELGHAHGLVHVNNPGDPMYYSTAIGTMRRSLTPEAIEGGKFMISNSAQARNSCTGGMSLLIPTITSFIPKTAKSAEMITITGTNFNGTTNVLFGNVKSPAFTVLSPTTIVARVGSGETGNLTVSTPGGNAISPGFIFTNKITQTLDFSPLPSKTYGDLDFAPGVIANTGLPITYTSSNPSIATIVNNMVHIVGAGSATIIATQAGDATYALATSNLSLIVNKADQIITFSSIPAKLTSDPDFDLGAMASSGLAVVYTNSNPSVATITNGRVHILKTGNTTITAVQDGNSNYNAAPTISYDLTVSNLPQILLFPEIAAKKVNDADFEPGATVNSGLPITYTSSNPNVATIENNKIHIVGAGTSTITASQNGNLIYAAASKQVILTVSKLNQTLSFPNLTVKDVNAMDFDAGAIASSNLAITYTSSNLNVATIVNNKVHILGAGTTTITALQIGDATYNAVSASANLTVIKLIQSINIPQIAIKTFNDPDFDLNATVSSGLSPIYTSSNTNVATVASNKVHIVGAGTASITVSQVGNAIYEAANNAVNLTVNKLPQTITFPQIALKNYNDVDFDLNAVSSSGLPITYKSANTSVATIIGSKVHIVASGSTVITASQIGDNNINTANEIAQNLDVIYTLPNSNFTIKTTDETCKTSDNGAINITATQTLSYVATITGNNKTTTHPFNSILAVNNLPSGLYNVCITIVGQTYKQCFDVVIKEPKDLAVYASLKDGGNTVLLKLEGSDFYKIELNGQLITTTDREISLPLIKGNNVVKISSNKTCQGVVEQSFITSNLISLYPNPVKDKLTINTGSAQATQVKVEIHALDGRLVHSGQYKTEYGQISIDLSKLNKSLYVLTLSNGNTKTVHKIIKD